MPPSSCGTRHLTVTQKGQGGRSLLWGGGCASLRDLPTQVKASVKQLRPFTPVLGRASATCRRVAGGGGTLREQPRGPGSGRPRAVARALSPEPSRRRVSGKAGTGCRPGPLRQHGHTPAPGPKARQSFPANRPESVSDTPHGEQRPCRLPIRRVAVHWGPCLSRCPSKLGTAAAACWGGAFVPERTPATPRARQQPLQGPLRPGRRAGPPCPARAVSCSGWWLCLG